MDDSNPDNALAGLLKVADLTHLAPAPGSVFSGAQEPVLASPHRLATAIGTAMAAQGCAVAEIWRQRSGESQDVRVDLRRAAHALDPARYLKQNGYSLSRAFHYNEPANGFFQTGDGRWVFINSLRPRLKNGLLELLDCANTTPALTAAFTRFKGLEFEAAAHERRLPVTMIRSAAEWAHHPHGRLLAATPVFTIEKLAPGAPQAWASAARPLTGVRAVELSHILAGPGIGRCLAEQGADVLRIAPPRQTDPINFVVDTGFGKRSAFLDLDQAADLDTLRRLTADGDVFIESFAPGALARRGLDPARLAAGHKGLIVVSISCFGLRDGPWSQHLGYDTNAQAATGINMAEGMDGRPGVPVTVLLADYLTAYLGAFGALAGLLKRAADGGSYHVRVSLAQTCMWVQGLGLMEKPTAVAPGVEPVLRRMNSPFGELEYLAPVTQYSRTPAYWGSPPVPLGAHRAEWL